MEREREEQRDSGWGGVLAGCVVGAGMLYAAGAIALGFQQKETEEIKAVNRRRKEKRLAICSKENEKKPPHTSNHQHNRDVPTEYDVYERKAVVYLYTSPLHELPKAVCTNYHHWEIGVHFEDDAYRVLDGYGDDKGRMCCRYKKERSTAYTNQIELGHVVTSPHRLRECAVTNVLNGTPYNSAQNNCQHWVLEVAKDIGRDIFKKLQEIDRPSEIIALLVGMGSALFSNFTKSAKSSM